MSENRILRFCILLLSVSFSTNNIFAEGRFLQKKFHLSRVLDSVNQIDRSYDESTSSTKKKFALVTASALNLRSSPMIGNNIIKILPKDSHVLTVSQPLNKWIKIKIPHAIRGWVATKYLKFYQPRALPHSNVKFHLNDSSSILEKIILQYMKQEYSQRNINQNDKLSLIVQDLSTGDILVSIRPSISIKSASTIKVPILHAYMIQRNKGIIKESSWHKKLIEEMIRFSSNPSTNSIIHLLGGTEKIQKILDQTKIYNELKLSEYFPVDGRSYKNKISAADLNQIFVKIWIKHIDNFATKITNNKEVYDEILFLLGLPGHPWIKDRIKAGTCFSSRKSVKIWDKTGFVKGSNGDAGIVQISTPYGRKAYSIVMFIERKNYKSIKDHGKDWYESTSTHMRRISEMTFAFFSNKYESHYECGHLLLVRYIKKVYNAVESELSL